MIKNKKSYGSFNEKIYICNTNVQHNRMKQYVAFLTAISVHNLKCFTSKDLMVALKKNHFYY